MTFSPPCRGPVTEAEPENSAERHSITYKGDIFSLTSSRIQLYKWFMRLRDTLQYNGGEWNPFVVLRALKCDLKKFNCQKFHTQKVDKRRPTSQRETKNTKLHT